VSLVLLVCILIILWNTRHLIAAELDWRILLSILIFVVTGLAAGHILGGPERGNRVALALTAASRHVGFAIAIGAAVVPHSVAVVAGTVLVYFVARGFIVLPYQKRMRSTGEWSPGAIVEK
jgi:bile acid:Na+ symporter, BASS family